MDQLDPAVAAQLVLTYIKTGMQVLATRVLSLLGLVATVALFGAALAQQSWLSLTAAGIFAVLVFLPLLWRDARKD